MARPHYSSVDEYIASQPDAVRGLLVRVRSAIRKAVPQAVEVISYQIPAYKLDGRMMLYFAGFKQHYSIYPATDFLLKELKNALSTYEVGGKATIRFRLTEPVPVKLIERIAKLRAREVRESARKKTK